MNMLRRTAAAVAALLLSLGIVSLAAPAQADTSWDQLTAGNQSDTSWDL